MDVIAGKDPRDSTSLEKKKEFLPIKEGVDAEVESAVWNAIHKLEDLGAQYLEIDMPNTEYSLSSYYIIAMALWLKIGKR